MVLFVFSGCVRVSYISDDDSLEHIKTSAVQGDDCAQLDLGLRYYIGQEVSRDYREAAKWSRKSAEQENSEAVFYATIPPTRL